MRDAREFEEIGYYAAVQRCLVTVTDVIEQCIILIPKGVTPV
jgi:hypothetical protein